MIPSSITEPHVEIFAWDRLCSPFATCDTRGISSLPHPEGEPGYILFQIKKKRYIERPCCLEGERHVCDANKRSATNIYVLLGAVD